MARVRLALLFASCAIGVAAASVACAPSASSADDEGSINESNVNEGDDLFAKPDALQVKLSAPVTKLFNRYKQGQADPPKPPKDAGPDAAPAAPVGFQEPEFSEPGKLIVKTADGEKTLDLRVYIRGESSKSDCPFPKLKIDFDDKDQLKKTPFKGHAKFRLNTHCGPGDASARSQLGRVMNGVGPVREELTYRLIRAMGIPTYQTRVLAIHYDDAEGNLQLDTFAMAMESGNDAAGRFQKMQPPLISDDAEFLDPNMARGSITPENTAEILVAASLSGNKDWGGTHNIDSFGVLNAPTMFQIAQDFDLGGIVLADIAHYWKGIAPVSDASGGLRNATIKAKVAPHKADAIKAYKEAEKAMIAAKAITAADDGTTNDPGFLEAKKRVEQMYDLPELREGPAPAADAGAGDAGDGG